MQARELLDKTRIVVLILILLLGIFVALSPGVVYAPAPKVVLYFLISLLPAILFGAEALASSKIQLRLPGFCFTTAGVFAACLGTLWFLTNLSKPAEKIAVFHILDESSQSVTLDWAGAVEVPVTDLGLTVSKFVEGNTVVLIFPEQVGDAEIRVKLSPTGPTYSGTVNYAGSRTTRLFLGKQLKLIGPKGGT